MNKKEFIVFCEESYGVEGNTHQHIIDALSADNIVYFIGASLPFKPSNLFKNTVLSKLDNNVFNFKYKNFLPNLFPRSVLGRLILKVNDRLNYNRFLNLTNNKQKDIIYFDPTKGVYFQGNKKYYYVLDPYYDRAYDKLFSQKANEIIVVNSEMATLYCSINENITIIPHGVPKISINTEKHNQLTQKYGSFSLLMGTLSDMVDYTLLNKLVDRFPNNNFVLIGKTLILNDYNTRTLNTIKEKKNVFYEGLINYKDIDNFITASRVCLVLYISEKLQYRNPIKLTNYLANNKIILNTFSLIDLKELEGKVLFTSTNHEEFMLTFDKAINNQIKVDKDFIKEYSKKYSYLNLVNDLFFN